MSQRTIQVSATVNTGRYSDIRYQDVVEVNPGDDPGAVREALVEDAIEFVMRVQRAVVDMARDEITQTYAQIVAPVAPAAPVSVQAPGAGHPPAAPQTHAGQQTAARSGDVGVSEAVFMAHRALGGGKYHVLNLMDANEKTICNVFLSGGDRNLAMFSLTPDDVMNWPIDEVYGAPPGTRITWRIDNKGYRKFVSAEIVP